VFSPKERAEQELFLIRSREGKILARGESQTIGKATGEVTNKIYRGKKGRSIFLGSPGNGN